MTIKQYDEKYLHRIVDLYDVTIDDTWTGYGKFSYDVLKSLYSVPTFTPDTRFVKIENDKVVGFISSAVENLEEKRASVQVPIVKGKERGLSKELLLASLNRLKEKGAIKFTTRIYDDNKEAIELFSEVGFKRKEEDLLYYSVKINEIKIPEVDLSKVRTEDMDLSKHIELLRDYYEAIGFERERADQLQELLKPFGDRFLHYKLVWYQNKFIGGIVLIRDSPDDASFSRPDVIPSENSEIHKNVIMSLHIKYAKELGYTKLQRYEFTRKDDAIEEFEEYGFKFITTSNYELILN